MRDHLGHNVAQFAGWLRAAFDAALLAGQPLRITQSACHSIAAPTAVIALGKAAGAMAEGARAAGVTAPGSLSPPMRTTARLMGLIVWPHHIQCLMGVACAPQKK